MAQFLKRYLQNWKFYAKNSKSYIYHIFLDFFWKTVKYGLHVSVSFRNLTLIPKMASDFMWERLTWIYCVPTLRAYIARLLLWTKHGLNTTIQKLTVIHISNFTVQQKNINWGSQYVWRWMIPNSGLKKWSDAQFSR